ncbi:MAG: hypothetical protein FWH10_00375 [Oscillospiraceae bacterium]|nr:hypothetical protein [Oscillospiraceae bacterium]
MMYPYITLADETEIVHSHLIEKNGMKTVEVYFERPSETKFFESARCSLPSYEWIMRDGFTDDEIKGFEDFAARHAHNFFYYAEIGGIPFAEAI